jgi:UDP-2,3-diacylglucosamine hydrolase
MKIVFIADAHIKGLDDPNQKSLAQFIDGLGNVDTLVILGDLFDFWTGFGNAVYCHYIPLLNSLIRLRRAGTNIIYVEGNHDFSMGDFFTGVLGAKVIPYYEVTDFDGKKFYLSHGDSVDGGLGHALWSRFLRSFVLKIMARIAGPSAVWNIAGRLSINSRKYNKPFEKVDAKLRVFAKQKISNGCFAVILGHSHLAGTHKEEADGKKGFYINPGSWMNNCSYAIYENGKFSIENYRPKNSG